MSDTPCRRRILVSAYACEPNRGSEPGVGWNWARAAAAEHDVWVLTRANNRVVIESGLAESEEENLHFLYCDLPRWARWLKRSTVGVQVYYVIWQLLAYFVARKAHKSIRFDVVHHLTFNSIDVPGLLWLLPVPFVWGPVGSGQVSPGELSYYYGNRWLFERIRTMRKRSTRWNPIVRMASKKAKVTLAANSDTRDIIRSFGGSDPILELETAVPTMFELEYPNHVRSGSHEKLTILWSGNLIYRKAPLLALDVVALLKARGIPVRLVVVGDGPLMSRVRRSVVGMGVEDVVELVGRVAHPSMRETYAKAHVLLFTSLQDTSGNVVLEAMASGLPVVGLDHQGVREMVVEGAGLKVPIRNRPQVISELADALQSLAADEGRRQAMGERARKHALCRHSWVHKRPLIRAIYSQAAEMLPNETTK